MPHKLRSPAAVACAAALLLAAGGARAAMTLTADGTGAGYSLSTFASGFPTYNFGGSPTLGPIGIGFPSTGGVLVGDATGVIRLFPNDVDNQTMSDATIGASRSNGNAWGITQVGPKNYFAGPSNLFEISGTGVVGQTIATGFNNARALVVNPNNNHLFLTQAGSGTGTAAIFDIDPVAKTKTTFIGSLSNLDGAAISNDGQTLYVAVEGVGGRIVGYDVNSKAAVFDSGTITANGVTGGIDGIAVGTGPLANFLFANLNSGSLVRVDRTTLEQVVVATDGSRGDFVVVDPYNGSLLITQVNSILRLTGPSLLLPPGDANGDGALTADDYALIDRGFARHLAGRVNGDFNSDGVVDSADYLIIDSAWSSLHPGDAAALLTDRESQFGPGYVSALAASVPEPACMKIGMIGALVARRRRRRRRPRYRSR